MKYWIYLLGICLAGSQFSLAQDVHYQPGSIIENAGIFATVWRSEATDTQSSYQLSSEFLSTGMYILLARNQSQIRF